MSLTISEDNPFQVLITETNNDVAELQSRYEKHRTTRNEQQRDKTLREDFPGWTVDNILTRLDGAAKEEGFLDPRNCLVIWARPPSHICDLISAVQTELKAVAPSLWLMPLENMHTTVLEVAHSLTEAQIEDLVQTLKSSTKITQAQIAEHPLSHRSRLLKPMVSFDSSAMALSFAPAAGEASTVQSHGHDHQYTYHHLRRDIFEKVRQTGIPVASRYIVPSAHITIARFITQEGFQVTGKDSSVQVDHSRVKLLVDKITDINERMKSMYWPQPDGTQPEEGEWVVGQNKLVIRRDDFGMEEN
ncbi:uncharacterized protein N7477_003714 [Penicillium maclennaniae]|uniref:uncharacterized protein n=1 Tax=Penicillium maclennaniae TaxID=1343394 RepID=UPI0025422755|nr:uncharacterized protein N7477_003714 [Penicillium maclennaniae]KAJ5678081.1 hypothetical protein N7477_003714 [Penicillium maclennaniae]